MSQADQALSMSACPAPTRRAFVLNTLNASAVASMAGVVVSAVAVVDVQSELFQRYLSARAEFLGIFHPRVPGYEGETDEWHELEARTGTAKTEAVIAINARVPATPADLVELAEVARLEAEDASKWGNQFEDGTYDFESKLARGILTLFGGDAHV